MNAIYSKKRIILFVLVFFSILFFMSYYVYTNEYKDRKLKVYFLSDKTYRSLIIKTKNNKIILLSFGHRKFIEDITKIIPFYKRKIDFIFIPNSFKNHISGYIDLLNRYEIGEVFISKSLSTSTELSLIKEKIKKNNIKYSEIDFMSDVYIDDVSVKVIFPITTYEFSKANQPELVFDISYKDTHLYSLGSISKTVQKYLYEEYFKHRDYNNVLLEIFSTYSKAKVHNDLIDYIKPLYIHNKNQKTTLWSFDNSWRREW